MYFLYSLIVRIKWGYKKSMVQEVPGTWYCLRGIGLEGGIRQGGVRQGGEAWH